MKRFCMACRVLLRHHNGNGGWRKHEPVCGPARSFGNTGGAALRCRRRHRHRHAECAAAHEHHFRPDAAAAHRCAGAGERGSRGAGRHPDRHRPRLLRRPQSRGAEQGHRQSQRRLGRHADQHRPAQHAAAGAACHGQAGDRRAERLGGRLRPRPGAGRRHPRDGAVGQARGLLRQARRAARSRAAPGTCRACWAGRRRPS